MLYDLFISFFIIILALIFLAAAGLTGLWLWRKSTAQEGAPSPKWGDLTFLKNATRLALVLRLAVVGILALIMLVPVSLISDLVRERYYVYNDAISEISESWGGEQSICGPVLVVPYSTKKIVTSQEPLTREELELEKAAGSNRKHREVKTEVIEHYQALVLPEELNMTGKVKTEERKRSIYSTRVYTATLEIEGSFIKPDIKTLRPDVYEVNWDKANLIVGMSSTRSIKDISQLNFAGKNYKFLPGTAGLKVLPVGFYSDLDLSQDKSYNFKFTLPVGGTHNLSLIPLGVKNYFALSSNWPHPKFMGSGLPDKREISPEGFTATWNLSNLVRNYPQFMDSQTITSDFARGEQNLSLTEYYVGVNFFEPVFHYSLLTRATKYALLFISLTFLAVLFYEVYSGKKNGQKLHIAQYGIIGLGLSLFYLLLLAISEHLPFLSAYLLAGFSNIIMVSGYIWASLKKRTATLVVGLIQLLLYTTLYFILQMEDYALLAGTTLLVLAMIALMAATKNLAKRNN